LRAVEAEYHDQVPLLDLRDVCSEAACIDDAPDGVVKRTGQSVPRLRVMTLALVAVCLVPAR
jgi:hypothetical protein